jgi:uncharacterized protein YggE
MHNTLGLVPLLALCSFGTVFGQTVPARNPFIRAIGEGTVAISPDQAKVDISVTTQAATADAAASQNAIQTQTVIDKLNQLLGANADIKTINYSLSPNYNYPPNGTPILVGFIANNTVEVTTANLNGVGKIIDTAVQAGANGVSSLRFGLQNDQPARQQALRLASIQAKAKADAIALGLGVHTGTVLAAQEGVVSVQPVGPQAVGAAATTTPVQPGSLTIVADVTLDVAITQ